MRLEDGWDLDKYFAIVGRAERSIQGPMLDRARSLHVATKKSTEELTARPKSRGRTEPSGRVDEQVFALLGRVDRLLRTLPRRTRQILESYHGDDGACCAEQMKKRYGRIVAVFGYTVAGQALLGRERKLSRKLAPDLKVTTLALIQNAVSRYDHESDKRDNDVVLAHIQALEAIRQAQDAYGAAAERDRVARDQAAAAARVRRVKPFTVRVVR